MAYCRVCKGEHVRHGKKKSAAPKAARSSGKTAKSLLVRYEVDVGRGYQDVIEKHKYFSDSAEGRAQAQKLIELTRRHGLRAEVVR